MSRRLFIVTARGPCGTHWLQSALDALPGVSCRRGPREEEGPPEEPIDLALRLRAAGRPDAFGLIGRYTLKGLSRAARRDPPQVDFELANLRRHPVPWLDASARHLAWRMADDLGLYRERLGFYQVNRELCDGLTRPFGVDPVAPEHLAFLFVCLGALPTYLVEGQVSGVLQVEAERLAFEPSYLGEVVEVLTGLAFDAPQVELAVAVAGPAPRRSPVEILRAWPVWRRACLRLALVSAPEAGEILSPEWR